MRARLGVALVLPLTIGLTALGLAGASPAVTASGPALDARGLAAAVQAAHPTVVPIGAIALANEREISTSFGEPLPDLLDAADVHAAALLGFEAPCADQPSGSTLSAMVLTTARSSGARLFVRSLRASAEDGGDAFREASVSGRVSPKITGVELGDAKGFVVGLSGNDSKGYLRDGTVTVVRSGTTVVVATALCSVATVTGLERQARVLATRENATLVAEALSAALG